MQYAAIKIQDLLKNKKQKQYLGLRTPLSKVPLLDDILLLSTISLECEKNEIVNMFLLAGDKFMPEMHLKQSGFTYTTCGPFTKNKKKNSKI